MRFLPGMTSASVKADIERVLDGIKADDPEFEYEIEMPPDPKHKVFTVVMEPFGLPRDEYILDCVIQQYRTVTGGREPDGVGTVLPGSYTGDDTTHLWRAGVPCVPHGPGGGSESDTIPDEFSRINDMEQVAKSLRSPRWTFATSQSNGASCFCSADRDSLQRDVAAPLSFVSHTAPTA